MGNKLRPKIILEGTRLIFKTEIAFELNEHPRIVGPRKYRYHSPLISAEWCTFTNVAWRRGPINFEAPEEKALALETYATWAKMFELPEDFRVAQSMLKNAGMAPREIDLLKEIATLRQLLSRVVNEQKKAEIQKQIQRKQIEFSLMLERQKKQRR